MCTWKCVCTVKAACTHARTGRGLVNAWKCDGSREGKPTTQASVTEARPGIPPRWNWKSWLEFVFVYLHLYLCICICICVFTFVFVYLHLYLCICICICVFAFVSVYLHLYLCICICVCAFAFVFVYLHLYLCVCICICVFVYGFEGKATARGSVTEARPGIPARCSSANSLLVNVLSNKTIFVGTFCKFSSCQCGNFLSNLTIFVFASTIAQWLMGDGRITWNRILEVGKKWWACISSCLKSNRLVSHHQWWHCGIDLIWCEVFGGTVT